MAQIDLATREDLRRLEAKIDALSAIMTPAEKPQWRTYADAARVLACSTDTISRRVKSGELQAMGNGRGRRVWI